MLIDNDIREAKLTKISYIEKPYYHDSYIKYILCLDSSNLKIESNIKYIDILDVEVNIKDFQNEEIERLLDINARLYRERDDLEDKNKKLNMELLNYQEMSRLEKLVSALCM